MTNRDKINNMSNEEFVEWCGKMLCNKINCKHLEADYSCKVYIKCDAHEKFVNWLSQEAELTADDMFTELGYKRSKEHETPITILYDNEELEQIIIYKMSLHYGKRNKSNISMLISEDEDRAIHKKIEELKNEG